MLLGQGRFVNQQTGYPIQLYDQINQIAIRAWKSIPNKGGLWRGPDPMLTWAQSSVCVFTQDQQDPVWVPEQLIRKIQHEEHHECQCGDASSPSHDESTGDGGAEMGDTVSVPKTYAGDV
ncbi:Putative Pol polyprotein [Cricetulus griseus]|uniref:Putative Pol polyprotein n=1 Tax=Cricetulus griseus TaxID=10029 RepID=G3H8J0_CRIGR|nr:Putative Pol polyprotein [Cricetulus griseus]